MSHDVTERERVPNRKPMTSEGKTRSAEEIDEREQLRGAKRAQLTVVAATATSASGLSLELHFGEDYLTCVST